MVQFLGADVHAQDKGSMGGGVSSLGFWGWGMDVVEMGWVAVIVYILSTLDWVFSGGGEATRPLGGKRERGAPLQQLL